VSAWFPDTYEASRARFRRDLDRVRARWPGARLQSHRLAGDEDLTIDWIAAPAAAPAAADRGLVFTLGEHGIEAYVGAAMWQLLLAEFLPRLDPACTGLCIVHAINPWGMKHWRRVTQGNVDLNRTFLLDRSELAAFDNPGYAQLAGFLNPQRPLFNAGATKRAILLRLVWLSARRGQEWLRRAVWLGQYRYPRGIYYGGDGAPEETQVLMALYREWLGVFPSLVHLDMHTGYGPRYQMSLVNSSREARASKDLAAAFGYPRVVKATADEFYSIHGDMIDFVYALAERERPGGRLYATSFEFGTHGDARRAIWRSMRAVIVENQAYWNGAPDARDARAAQDDFRELFCPAESQWREQALSDARRAMAGILGAEGYLAA
jgi:hypothetical protein